MVVLLHKSPARGVSGFPKQRKRVVPTGTRAPWGEAGGVWGPGAVTALLPCPGTARVPARPSAVLALPLPPLLRLSRLPGSPR